MAGSKEIDRILVRFSDWIANVSARYGVPASAIKAILHKEMSMIDVFDLGADLAVRAGLFGRKDSSTGYAQIFGRVGIVAANYAVGKGYTTYGDLGLACEHMLDAENPQDVRMVWERLNGDPYVNIELATANLLVAAEEVVGRTDFAEFSEGDFKRVFSRYNARTTAVTAYGRDVYRIYVEYEMGIR